MTDSLLPDGHWTGALVTRSDPERIAELLNRRYDALLRLATNAPHYAREIAQEGLRDD